MITSYLCNKIKANANTISNFITDNTKIFTCYITAQIRNSRHLAHDLGRNGLAAYQSRKRNRNSTPEKELCDILDRLKAANFNTVLLQTRLRGDMIYPSSIETFAGSLTGYTGRNPGYDPLAFAIEECHKRGMELHAWIVTIPAGNTRQVKLLGRNSIVQRNRKYANYIKVTGIWIRAILKQKNTSLAL